MTKLYPGRVYDVTTTAVTHTRGGHSLEAHINDLLSHWSFWRIGHADGRWSLLRVASPYRTIALWPKRRTPKEAS